MARFNFGREKLPTLKKRSDKILDVFTKTQVKCEQVNAQIINEVGRKSQEMAKIQQEMEDLRSIHDKNSNLIKKVQKFTTSEDTEQTV